MMRPRSSSRGSNTSVSVAVTVTVHQKNENYWRRCLPEMEIVIRVVY